MNAITLPTASNAYALTSYVPLRAVHHANAVTEALSIKSVSLEPLFSYIIQSTGISLCHEERLKVQQAFKVKVLKRRQYFLQEGEVCKYMAFIVKGSMRMYTINDKGQECIVAFGLENNWLTDEESYSMLTPSGYHIEALENTQLLIISNSQLQLLSAQIPAIAQMILITNSHKLIATQQRVHAAISMTAEERYHNLLTIHPEYAQRFSQNMIAAYLGIKSETLSRLRKR